MSSGSAAPSRALSLLRALVSRYGRGASGEPEVAAELATVRRLLRQIPAPDGALSGSDHPVARHLAAALEAAPPGATEIALELRQLGASLPWRYSYPRRNDAGDLEARVAFAELVGPAAPFRSTAVCLGLTLIAPHTLYPDHSHPAVELYDVLSGTATWSADGGSRLVPPGSFVLHLSGAVHSMRTGVEPLLAAYAWTGADVVTPSVYV